MLYKKSLIKKCQNKEVKILSTSIKAKACVDVGK